MPIPAAEYVLPTMGAAFYSIFNDDTEGTLPDSRNI
jgi:hypothetical protein